MASAASVQPPTIYRLVGDKDALLDAVAEHELAAYIATKIDAELSSDPVEALRQGWDSHVAFGLSNPALFRIMSSKAGSSAAAEGLKMLALRIHSIALAGRLHGSEERAVATVHAACTGVIVAALAQLQSCASLDLCTTTREIIHQAITTIGPGEYEITTGSTATALRARLPTAVGLTGGERALMDELLLRLSNED